MHIFTLMSVFQILLEGNGKDYKGRKLIEADNILGKKIFCTEFSCLS